MQYKDSNFRHIYKPGAGYAGAHKFSGDIGASGADDSGEELVGIGKQEGRSDFACFRYTNKLKAPGKRSGEYLKNRRVVGDDQHYSPPRND